MEMLYYEFSHKLKRFCKHMKPNVTAVIRRLKRATKLQTTTRKKIREKLSYRKEEYFGNEFKNEFD